MARKLSAITTVTPAVIASAELAVETPGEGFLDITADARKFLKDAQARDGALLLFLRHTSASLTIQENADPDVLRDLVTALRQCDGERIQCLLLVRDDFWMAVSRFMHELDVPLVEGRNCAAVNLFDRRHAKRVLVAFGRAYGALPDRNEDLTEAQHRFVDEAVDELAEGEAVIAVRLSLFADMVRGKEWSAKTLREVGGLRGVGVAFLEETFSASHAPPVYRAHQKAVKALLKALLPEGKSEIRGHRRSRRELIEAAAYARRPKDFDELIRILDSEVRLLTPVDPEALDNGEVAEEYYQLTHDYLVPTVRDWLTSKQKETLRGRTKLMLGELASAWKASPSAWSLAGSFC